MIGVGVDASAFLGFEGEVVEGCFEIFDPFPSNGGEFWFHSSNVSHGTDKNEDRLEPGDPLGSIAALWQGTRHSGTMLVW